MFMTNEPIETSLLPRQKRLKNGAIYDLDKKHIVSGPTSGLITSERAKEFIQERKERKRQAIVEAANRVAEQAGWDGKGDLDYVEAIGEAVMAKALNATDTKQVEAARFILRESGIAEDDTRQVAGADTAAMATLGRTALTAILAQIEARREVIDAEVEDDN